MGGDKLQGNLRMTSFLPCCSPALQNTLTTFVAIPDVAFETRNGPAIRNVRADFLRGGLSRGHLVMSSNGNPNSRLEGSAGC